jgi:iron complex outermembrane receptor protein
LRAEDYSDFGSNLSGKLAGRYDFTESFALRGSVQNGFRAPSLQQQFFATTSTNFINGVPYDITTFPATDPVAQALGAQPLDAETSVNFSLGAVMRLSNLTITLASTSRASASSVSAAAVSSSTASIPRPRASTSW